jgi:hypothetical protein
MVGLHVKNRVADSIKQNRLPRYNLIYQTTTEESVLPEYIDKKLLETSLDEFNFSARICGALERNKLNTIGDVLNVGWSNIYRLKNVGRKSIEELRHTIEDYVEANMMIEREETEIKSYRKENASFTSVIEIILASSLTDKQRRVIKARYGYEDGKKKTLEKIGNTEGVTRERIRQIIAKSQKRLQHPSKKIYFHILLEHTESALLNHKGIIGINDLSKEKFFNTKNKNLLKFSLNLITDLYEDRYRIIDKSFLTSFSDEELKEFHTIINDTVLQLQFPINEKVFFQQIIKTVGNISKDYLYFFLIKKKHIKKSNKVVLTPGKLTVPQKIKLIMRGIDIPLHFTKITKLYQDYFRDDLTNKVSDIERSIHARISDSHDFIIVGPGTFILRDKFKTPDNINEIIKSSREILRSVNNISDTKYLMEKLKQRQIDIGFLNAYSLKNTLLEYPGFVSYKKFEIGLEELSDQYERKSLSDLIYDVLIKIDKPQHSNRIWKQLSEQRGFPKYAIEQRLYKEPQFIKTAPSTYTVKEHIPSYEQKYKLVVNFAKEWINLKGHAVSAFFVNEVLKATEEIKDLTMGFVEHILATSPEFNKVSNGFYNLADK